MARQYGRDLRRYYESKYRDEIAQRDRLMRHARHWQAKGPNDNGVGVRVAVKAARAANHEALVYRKYANRPRRG